MVSFPCSLSGPQLAPRTSGPETWRVRLERNAEPLASRLAAAAEAAEPPARFFSLGATGVSREPAVYYS